MAGRSYSRSRAASWVASSRQGALLGSRTTSSNSTWEPRRPDVAIVASAAAVVAAVAVVAPLTVGTAAPGVMLGIYNL